MPRTVVGDWSYAQRCDQQVRRMEQLLNKLERQHRTEIALFECVACLAEELTAALKALKGEPKRRAV